MSILHHELPHARVVDLFAGSGALGLEALSRGASHCDFVEMTPAGVRAIAENAESLGASDRVTIHRADATRFVDRSALERWDIAFADPPYNLGLAPQVAASWIAAPFARILGVEHDVHEQLPVDATRRSDTRTYGATAITIYRLE